MCDTRTSLDIEKVIVFFVMLCRAFLVFVAESRYSALSSCQYTLRLLCMYIFYKLRFVPQVGIKFLAALFIQHYVGGCCQVSVRMCDRKSHTVTGCEVLSFT